MESYTSEFFNSMGENKNSNGNRKKHIIIFSSLAVVFIFFVAQSVSIYKLLNPKEPYPLSLAQKNSLEQSLNKKYPERTDIVSELPFQYVPADLFVNAESAIVVDFATGNILFEKNADVQIPPASMTKLVEMYVVFEAVENGEISLDGIVPLPPESWARNLPSDASIMFLDEGQKVTLRELLLGLAIASGNDASIAVAKYVCGNMDSFVERMNQTVKRMGLVKTEFVESSGYSEKNVTTAKEFSAFCRKYIERFPFAIKEFHSQKVLRYPLAKNLPKESAERNGDSQAVIQYNTNKLLGSLEGCDGLKTGFIYESGFNIALTAERDGVRYISVTMKGPGIGSAQGNIFRVKDGTNLMEYAFSKFSPYIAKQSHSFFVGVAGSSLKSVCLVPAKSENFSVPFISGVSPKEAAQKIHVTASIPKSIFGEFEEGTQFGSLSYSLDGRVLNTIPLVADRKSEKINFFARAWGSLAYRISSLK